MLRGTHVQIKMGKFFFTNSLEISNPQLFPQGAKPGPDAGKGKFFTLTTAEHLHKFTMHRPPPMFTYYRRHFGIENFSLACFKGTGLP